MTRVLLVGYDPETVDFSNAALPPVMSGEKRHVRSRRCELLISLSSFACECGRT